MQTTVAKRQETHSWNTSNNKTAEASTATAVVVTIVLVVVLLQRPVPAGPRTGPGPSGLPDWGETKRASNCFEKAVALSSRNPGARRRVAAAAAAQAGANQHLGAQTKTNNNNNGRLVPILGVSKKGTILKI